MVQVWNQNNFFSKALTGKQRRFGYSSRGKMWDSYMKNKRKNWKRSKSAWCFYRLGSQYREAEGRLKLRSDLYGAILTYDPSIGKYINKHEFYRQCPPIRKKDTNMNEIENYLFVINVMILAPVLNKER